MVARGPDAGPDQWEKVLAVDPADAFGTGVAGFSGDGGGLYLLSSVGANTSRLLYLDLALGRVEVLAEDHRHDIVASPCTPTAARCSW